MKDENDIEMELRDAALDQLELAFYQSNLADNISHARALVAFLQLTAGAGDEPSREALHGYSLIMALLDIVLAQANRRVKSDRLRSKAEAQLRSADGESAAVGGG